ncbi:tyrosine-type recombinase/integrase [Micavibrio aeruginosavorus]|uniref:Phage integrase family protein n=1 Tax=Micavibrio aeruginosavorus (strain ARL-13) TaxID=856793 RepID=G2KNV7_MICAA|nr:integrase arm-type DNA-binding domain-containing protein [Micavibrio aeruginosavorus]AEP10752.1 phage integrase family protein [Micavibrio aeruginosavorus ARL-13]
MTLTNTTCKNAKPKEKPYKLADGGGLYLLVNPNGAKHWRLKYRFLGKEKLLAIGPYPLTSLADARQARDDAKKLIQSGADPVSHKREGKRNALRNAQNTFEAVALEWVENQKERWSPKYAEKVLRGLTVNIFPEIGQRPIAQITPPELLDALRKIEKRGALDIAGRTKQICGQVFRYGIQTGKCTRDASADLRGALKGRKAEHFASIDPKELPAFLKALGQNDARLYARTRRAIHLSMLCFTRPGEIRQAQWSEMDFEARQWVIPAERMKMRRDHIVPLSMQAIAILEAQREETGKLNTPYVFPSQIQPRKPMSDGTVNQAVKRLGYTDRMTAHGFRALARTAIREALGYDSEIIEKQLAHRTSNPLGEAYDRTQFLSQRKKMMQDWADHLDSIAHTHFQTTALKIGNGHGR